MTLFFFHTIEYIWLITTYVMIRRFRSRCREWWAPSFEVPWRLPPCTRAMHCSSPLLRWITFSEPRSASNWLRWSLSGIALVGLWWGWYSAEACCYVAAAGCSRSDPCSCGEDDSPKWSLPLVESCVRNLVSENRLEMSLHTLYPQLDWPEKSRSFPEDCSIGIKLIMNNN